MTRRFSIALLLLALVPGVLILALGGNSTLKLVSTQVVTIPSRGRAVEFVLKNNSDQSSGCQFYRQQSFNGRWVPETVTLYQRADEVCYVSAGREATVTLRAPDSGGRFRFQIFYGKPPPLHERLSELVRKKFGLRRKGLHGQWGTIITDSIDVPPR